MRRLFRRDQFFTAARVALTFFLALNAAALAGASAPAVKIKTPVIFTGTQALTLQFIYQDWRVPAGGIDFIFQGQRQRLRPVWRAGNTVHYALPKAPKVAGKADIAYALNDGIIKLPGAITVLAEIVIGLTFDDGPATGHDPEDGEPRGSPTNNLLALLARHNFAAAFFVLTGSERFRFFHYKKGESADGAALLQKMAAGGYIIGAHSGGDYQTQQNTHPKRLRQAAYDIDGDGLADGQSALESDLLHCINRVKSVTGQRPEFVRPLLWRLREKRDPPGTAAAVLAVYQRLGLKPILTDARFPDGGYALISFVAANRYAKFRKNLRAAFNSGESELIISMHDSNSYTVNSFACLIKMLRQTFMRHSFAGYYPTCEQLRFVRDNQQLLEILRRKERFVMAGILPAPIELPRRARWANACEKD